VPSVQDWSGASVPDPGPGTITTERKKTKMADESGSLKGGEPTKKSTKKAATKKAAPKKATKKAAKKK
jgi:hypothetical protein